MSKMKDKKQPDYIANCVTDDGSDKGRWKSIGVGFNNPKSGTISVLLDALPLGGKIILTKYVPKEEGGYTPSLSRK